MNPKKMFSGIAALLIYLSIIFTILFYYNIHKTKAKKFVEKDSKRVTVTLVNSDKTVFNRSDDKTIPTKPTPIVPPKVIPKKVIPKKVIPKKIIVKNVELPPRPLAPKKVIKPKPVPKKVVKPKPVPKKVVKPKPVPKKVVKPKPVPKKVVKPKPVPKKVVKPKPVPKKVVKPKPVPKKVVKPKPVPKKVVKPKPVPKKVVKKKKSAKDLFATVDTKDVKKRPVKKAPPKPKYVPRNPSSVKHNESVIDRIKSTHQSGRVSNANRDSGIKNAYIAKVKRHMNNWDATSSDKGKRVSIQLIIYSSGKFKYTILKAPNGSMTSLRNYLDTLNRIGLGRHSKSTAYDIKVNFTAR